MKAYFYVKFEENLKTWTYHLFFILHESYVNLFLYPTLHISRRSSVGTGGRLLLRTPSPVPFGTCIGSIYVILLRPTIGLAPTKHDVISMLAKQYTHIKYLSLQRSHLLVFIKPRYIDQIITFSQICVAAEWKSTHFWGDLSYYALKRENLPKWFRQYAECPNEAYFPAKRIWIWMRYSDFEIQERPHEKLFLPHSACTPKTSRQR